MNPIRRQHLSAYFYFVILMLVMTYPLVFEMHERFMGDPFSDAYEYSRHIWWMAHALQNGEPVFFQPLLAYPDGLNGAWLWGNPLQSFPAWLFAFVMPLPAAFNLAALVHLSLNGWAVYYLAWHLTRSAPAALLGGTVFALFPTIQGHLIASHIGLVTLWGVPLYVVALLRLRAGGSWRGLLLAALFFVVSLLGNNLLLVYALFPVTLLLYLSALVGRQWRGLAWMTGGGLLGGAVALVFVLPVALEQLDSPLPPPGGDVRYSADLLAVVTPSFYNPLFTDLTYSRRVLGGINNIEGSAYIGLTVALLAAVALWRVREARWWGMLALLAWVLSLGPLLKVMDRVVTVDAGGYTTHIVLPWAVLMNLPVLNIARTPARFNFAVGLAAAMLAAYGLHWLLQQRFFQRRAISYVMLAGLVPLIAFEYQVWWEGSTPRLNTIVDLQADPITALRDDPDVRAVFNIPYDHLLVAKDGLYLQTRHHKPLIGGHVTRRTPVPAAKLLLMQSTLDPALLDEAGADVVILHREWADPDGQLEAHAYNRLGEPFYADERLIAWYAPDPATDTAFAAQPFDTGQIDDTEAGYIYAPGPGWSVFTADVNGTGTLRLHLNDETLHRWQIDGAAPLHVPISLTRGYHTVTLERAATCPDLPGDALECEPLMLDASALGDFQPTSGQPIVFERGITLQAAHLSDGEAWLHWQFAQAVDASPVRFVHLLDAEGQLAAQVDTPFALPDGAEAWTEAVTLPTAGLPPGDYTAYLGWYTLPDVARVPVLSDVNGAADDWVALGTVQVRDD